MMPPENDAVVMQVAVHAAPLIRAIMLPLLPPLQAEGVVVWLGLVSDPPQAVIVTATQNIISARINDMGTPRGTRWNWAPAVLRRQETPTTLETFGALASFVQSRYLFFLQKLQQPSHESTDRATIVWQWARLVP
jgi:hypothetical protein